MQDIGTYQIEVQGQVEENALHATGPLRVTVVRADPADSLFEVHADQSGLIGLLRYLHQQGFLLLSVCRK